MFRESNLNGSASRVTASEGALRHPDGSINFDAYRKRARDARNAAITASMRGAVSSLVANVFAGKLAPAAKHQAM
jgi:hypothetical protein